MCMMAYPLHEATKHLCIPVFQLLLPFFHLLLVLIITVFEWDNGSTDFHLVASAKGDLRRKTST